MAVTSVPLRQIRSVSVVGNKSMMSGFFSSSSIAIDAGGTRHMAEFRGHERARHIHNLVMAT